MVIEAFFFKFIFLNTCHQQPTKLFRVAGQIQGKNMISCHCHRFRCFSNFAQRVVLPMAFRLFVGGLPAWVDHETLLHWTWHHTGVRALQVQIVRKHQDETMVSAFLGFRTGRESAQVLSTMSGILFWGCRITWRVSRDSRQGPVPMRPTAPVAAAVPGASPVGAAVPGAPMRPPDVSPPVAAAVPVAPMRPPDVSCPVGAAVPVAPMRPPDVSPPVPMQMDPSPHSLEQPKHEKNTDSKVLETTALSGEVEAEESKTSLGSTQEKNTESKVLETTLLSGEDEKKESKTSLGSTPAPSGQAQNKEEEEYEFLSPVEPIVVPKDDDNDTLVLSPTEKYSSPTEDEAPTDLSEPVPTMVMDEETREKMDLQKNLFECKEEIQELKEELNKD